MKLKTLGNATVACMTAIFFASAMPGEQIITKEGKTVIVNTTAIAGDIKGYNGATPLKIYITNNKVEKIEALPNSETPKYFFKVKKAMLDKWNGLNVSKASKAKVDGVTGCTYSSDAVKKTVERGLEYYKKNK